MKNMKHLITASAVIPATFFSANLLAASVTYDMTQTNSDFLLDGTSFASVTISDSMTDNNIYFSVEVNESAFTLGNNFGMQSFYFNYTDGLTVTRSNVTDITPDTWVVSTTNGSVGPFGVFEFLLDPDRAKGSNRTSLLTFTISGVDGDSIYDYAIGHDGSTTSPYFAAHIAGYEISGESETSAMFATVVPLPAAAWLFGTGLIGLTGIARRRRM